MPYHAILKTFVKSEVHPNALSTFNVFSHTIHAQGLSLSHCCWQRWQHYFFHPSSSSFLMLPTSLEFAHPPKILQHCLAYGWEEWQQGGTNDPYFVAFSCLYSWTELVQGKPKGFQYHSHSSAILIIRFQYSSFKLRLNIFIIARKLDIFNQFKFKKLKLNIFK